MTSNNVVFNVNKNIQEIIMKKTALIFLLITLSIACFAQVKGINPHYKFPSLFDSGLINPNNMKMSHSMSFSSSYSSSSFSTYNTTYTNHIEYKLRSNLKLNLNLNFSNFGTGYLKKGFEFDSNDDNSTKVFPEIQLIYKPTENTMLKLEFRQSNPYSYKNYYYYR